MNENKFCLPLHPRSSRPPMNENHRSHTGISMNKPAKRPRRCSSDPEARRIIIVSALYTIRVYIQDGYPRVQ